MLKAFLNMGFSKFIVALAYAIIYKYGYVTFLNKNFEYVGFRIIEGRLNEFGLLIMTFLIVLLPLVFFRKVEQISSLLCTFVYYILYIPIIFAYFFDEPDKYQVLYKQLFFLVGMSFLFLADRIKFGNKLVFPSSINVMKLVLVITGFLTIFVAIVYRGNLQFVSLADVYLQRSANADVGSDIFTRYLSIWLANAFIPICLAYGLFSNKRIYFILGTVASLVLYMATAAKSALFYPLITYVLFRVLKPENLKYSFNVLGLGLASLMIVSLQFGFNIYTSILWWRTLGNAGQLTKAYDDFFSFNPITYYSHINFVNSLTQNYPYQETIGEVVGKYYWDEVNANANFWATDGIAALGDVGIIVSSFLLFWVFVAFNYIARSYSTIFIILILIPYITSLLNTSLFTSILSGGAFITFTFLLFKSSLTNKYIRKS